MYPNRLSILCKISFALSMFVPLMANVAAAADPPVPNETLVSLQPDLIDAEYSQSRAQFVWADRFGNIWIGNVDSTTGLFDPVNGKAILVDPEAMKIGDLTITRNGPEWVGTANGDEIVYTKFSPTNIHKPRTARLALAQEGADGLWYYTYLGPDRPRLAPYSSLDMNDPTPRITYRDFFGRQYWRELYAATTEQRIPLLPRQLKSVRFVEGQRQAIFSTLVDGISQVFLYDLDAGTVEQLTFDATDKDLQTVPWMWRAPELDNDYVFVTIVNNNELRVYRKIDVDGDFQWVPIYSVAMPAGSKPASPEPFVYDGKSYVFMAMNVEPDTFPSSIWLSNIDAAEPLFSMISDDSPVRARSDPEVFITSNGPYVYYNRYNPSINPEQPYCGECSEGVFRAFTGLGPLQQQTTCGPMAICESAMR